MTPLARARWRIPSPSEMALDGEEGQMLRIERILCPVDFSEFSVRAYDYAHSVARQYEAKLFLQHVAEPLLALYSGYISQTTIDEIYAQQTEHVQEQLRSFLARYEDRSTEPEVILHQGYPADSILLFAESERIDVIVMGTHGRRGFDRVVLGSVTERVLRNSACPVLAVHDAVRGIVNSADLERPVNIRKILLATDFSDNSPRALEYAFSLGTQYDAEVTLLHVLGQPAGKADPQTERAAVLRQLEQVIPSEARTWSTVIPAVRRGRPYEEIVQHANEIQPDLIVMGVRGRNAIDLALFGSTTHRVIQLGPCPVLAVRT